MKWIHERVLGWLHYIVKEITWNPLKIDNLTLWPSFLIENSLIWKINSYPLVFISTVNYSKLYCMHAIFSQTFWHSHIFLIMDYSLFTWSEHHLEWLWLYVWLRGTCFTLTLTPGLLVEDVVRCNQIMEPLIWSRPPDELNLDLQLQRCNMKGHGGGWWWCVCKDLTSTDAGTHRHISIFFLKVISILFRSTNVR